MMRYYILKILKQYIHQKNFSALCAQILKNRIVLYTKKLIIRLDDSMFKKKKLILGVYISLLRSNWSYDIFLNKEQLHNQSLRIQYLKSLNLKIIVYIQQAFLATFHIYLFRCRLLLIVYRFISVQCARMIFSIGT